MDPHQPLPARSRPSMPVLTILLHPDLFETLLAPLASCCIPLALCNKALNERYGEESLSWKDYSFYKKAAHCHMLSDGWSCFVVSLVFDEGVKDGGKVITPPVRTFWGLQMEIVREAQRLKKVAKRFQVMMEFRKYYPVTNAAVGLRVSYLPESISWVSDYRVRTVAKYRMYVSPDQRLSESLRAVLYERTMRGGRFE